MNGHTFGQRLLIMVFIVGVVMTYIGATDIVRGNTTPADYSTLEASDVKKGLIVEGDLVLNLGAFMESYTTTNGVKTGSSQYTYLIPVGENEYMGLENNTSTMESQLDAQTEFTYDYLSGGGSTSTEPVIIHFKGRVLGMDSESKGYMRSYMLDLGYTDNEINSYALSYYIKCENYDGGPVEIAIGIVCLVIGAAILLIPMLSARKRQNVMFAHETPQAGTAYLQDDFDSFQSEEYDNIDNTQNTASHSYDTSGLGAGIADDYKPEQSNSGLGLKLKDD